MKRPPLDTTVEGTPPRPPDTATAVLVVGEGQMRVVTFAGDELVIGRSSECDVVIDNKALSRRHAVVRRRPTLHVEDLGSTNGTKVGEAVLTGGATAELAVGGAFYIGPFSFVIVASPPAHGSSRPGAERLHVEDPSQERVGPLVQQIARSGVNVLIQGETGAGKDVLATTLHVLSGRRGPLLQINCAALSETLLESELFGHEKGAFTGAGATKIGLLEAAADGTALLDEIGELPLGTQAKLLRAIETRKVLRLGATQEVAIDVRFLAASNRDLPVEVAEGRFREDLFFRIDGVTLHVLPLRESPGRIVPLAQQFLAETAARHGRGAMQASPDFFAALAAHGWPGNVRELRAVVERAVLLASGSEVGARHLVFAPRGSDHARPVASRTVAPGADDGPPDELELVAEQKADRERVIAALARYAGNQTRAARELGVSRSTLISKMILYRIPRPRT
ncbi:MAG TPA: sigma 54-interacting transcriptional regulator [Kofleriaceae bacterium]|nr:sigma 54-interacting transcriptional regulator [Kofleriaceae bacterium]